MYRKYPRDSVRPVHSRWMSNLPTNPTIFLRLREIDPTTREIAWSDFHSRYAPIIRAFVQRLGLADADVEDCVQDVMVGFFSKSPTFQYDPAKGRFRGYLKTCAYHAASRRAAARARNGAKGPAHLDEVAIEHLWEDVWEVELLRQTIEALRVERGSTKTFQAFERYVMFEEPAEAVAGALEMNLNSVYRAKEQMVQLLQQRLADRRADFG